MSVDVREMGTGSFGAVYALLVSRGSVAIKACAVKGDSELTCLWALRQARIPHTVYALAALRNAGPPLVPERCPLLIAMTLVQGITLREYLAARCALSRPLALDSIRRWMAQLVDFLLHLEVRLHFSHNDLKLGNIMVEHVSLELRVIDFTFASHYDEQSADAWQCGTVCYMAPERLFLSRRPAWSTLPGADLWALGTLIATLVLAAQPLTEVLSPSEAFYAADEQGLFNPRHTDTVYHLLPSGTPWLVRMVRELVAESGIDGELVQQGIRLLLWTRARFQLSEGTQFGLPMSMPGLETSPLCRLIDRHTTRVLAAYDASGSKVYEKMAAHLQHLMGPQLHALWHATQRWNPSKRGDLAILQQTLGLYAEVTATTSHSGPPLSPPVANSLDAFLSLLNK